MNPLYKATIPGRPLVKKNTQRTYGRGKATRRVSTPRYRVWEKNAIAACKRANSIASIDTPVTAIFRFFLKDRQAEPDVSNLIEGPQDVLVDCGVLKDDRLISLVIAEKFIGHEPRVEIELFAYERKLSNE